MQADSARLLGELGDPAAVEDLIAYTRKSRHCYKTAGMEALARIGDQRAVPVLRELCDAPNVQNDWYWFMYKSVRAASATALLMLGDDSGADYLHELADADDDAFYGWFAPSLLRLSNDRGTVHALQQRLTVESMFAAGKGGLRETDPGFVITVAEALALVPDDEHEAAVAALCELLSGSDSRYVRAQAARSLHVRGEQQHLQQWMETTATDFERITALALQSDEHSQEQLETLSEYAGENFDRAAAVTALGQRADDAAATCCIARLHDNDAWVRQCAVAALERIGGAGTTALFKSMLDDPAPRVRLQAAKALVVTEVAA